MRDFKDTIFLGTVIQYLIHNTAHLTLQRGVTDTCRQHYPHKEVFESHSFLFPDFSCPRGELTPNFLQLQNGISPIVTALDEFG